MSATGDPLLERRAQALPRLTDDQLLRVETYGQRRVARAGEVLFQLGDEVAFCYVILSGSVEIVAFSDREEARVALHGPGEFTGEVNMLSHRRALVRGLMVTEGEVIAIPTAKLRIMMQRDSELGEIFMRAFILRRVGLLSQGHSDLILLGSRHSAQTLALKEFLTRNGHPYRFRDVETDAEVTDILSRFGLGVDEIPVVICRGGRMLKNPSLELLAEHLGLHAPLASGAIHDLVIVGAGPAGLGAAVYAASEGLDVLVLESTAPGGQAGTSSRIENYLGFPLGISGLELAARAAIQAEKFGADIAMVRTAAGLDCSSRPYKIQLANGEVVHAKTVVIATGAQYRRPTFKGLNDLEGAGVYYSATNVEAQLCVREEVVVVGGGNSAGQAAVYLSKVASRVHVLVRGHGLAESMSRYLISRLEDTANITLRTRTQIEELEGEKSLKQVRWRNVDTGEVEDRAISHVFIMTGADPNTAWLQDCLMVDNKKFIKTGTDLTPDDLRRADWSLERAPYLMESSLPGVFAVGDVRASSVKRVASAVGEGSVCVQLVHKALAEI